MNMTRRLVGVALAAVATIAVALPISTGAAVGAPAPAANPVEQNKVKPNKNLPLVYVGSGIETEQLAQTFAVPMRMRGYDVHVFLTNDAADPANNPFFTIRGNSAKLGRFVDAIAKRTGKQVNVVGASQTGIVIRYWLKYYGGQKHTRTAVLLSGMIKGSPYQSTWLEQGKCPPSDRLQYLPPKLRKVNPTPACLEQAMAGKQINALNSPSEALPGVRYVNITTMQEEEAAPFWINLMDGPGNYTNVVTQNLCPNDPVIHTTLTVLPSMQSLIDSALRGGRPKMDCMVPVIPGAPTLKSTIKVVKNPPGARMPTGTNPPAWFKALH